MKKLSLIGAIVIGMLVVSGLYSPGDADDFYGCYKKNNGQLRIVSSLKKCLKSEKPIILNATGLSNDYGWKLNKRNDYCWSFSNPTFEVSGTLQLRFTNIGGGHHLCSGLMTVTESENNSIFGQFPAYGNAEIVGEEIYITLSVAGIRDEVMGINMFKIILNPTTLSGTGEDFGVFIDAVEFSEFTLTHTTCQ